MYNLSATRVEVTTENLYNEVAKPTKRRNSMASYKHLTIGSGNVYTLQGTRERAWP